MSYQPSVTCPKCSMTSYNPNDIVHGYCGNCHDWTSGPLREFTCALCGNAYVTRTTSAEKNRELVASGKDTSSGLATVCDSCYQRAKDLGVVPMTPEEQETQRWRRYVQWVIDEQDQFNPYHDAVPDEGYSLDFPTRAAARQWGLTCLAVMCDATHGLTTRKDPAYV